ncbi:hypothetical protein O181_126079 [Austropuccinia psidii MF-1]|uniref:Uncharacterized protein n=1 Tax=Austropuccinia psidii MF-1 TaxID=1389203 RepID=A0A9Q3KSN7_9BASI|nr:hypothetical protein [Austropuccinia psidii MF-1]
MANSYGGVSLEKDVTATATSQAGYDHIGNRVKAHKATKNSLRGVLKEQQLQQPKYDHDAIHCSRHSLEGASSRTQGDKGHLGFLSCHSPDKPFHLPVFHAILKKTISRFCFFFMIISPKIFSACVVPPLPDKSRLNSSSNPFKIQLLKCCIKSTQWNVDKYTHLVHPPIPEPPTSLLDLASEDGLDWFEERLNSIERIELRSRNCLLGLANDYEGLAASIHGLGFLESGITDPLSCFKAALLDYSLGLRDLNTLAMIPLINKLVSLPNYSESFRNVLKCWTRTQ